MDSRTPVTVSGFSDDTMAYNDILRDGLAFYVTKRHFYEAFSRCH